MSFGGETFDEALDGERLTGQLGAVFNVMKDGEWRTLLQIASIVRASEAGISARLRDLRKEKFGGYDVRRRRVEGVRGLWQYRVVLP